MTETGVSLTFATVAADPFRRAAHHDRDQFAGNYANISPLMDVLFGTYRCPGHEPERFGVEEPIRQNYLAQMFHPFRRRRAAETQVSATAPANRTAHVPVGSTVQALPECEALLNA